MKEIKPRIKGSLLSDFFFLGQRWLMTRFDVILGGAFLAQCCLLALPGVTAANFKRLIVFMDVGTE